MTILAVSFASMAILAASCSDEVEMRRPPKLEVPVDLPVTEIDRSRHAPLYWSVYEYCYTREQQGVKNEDMDITPAQWDEIIDWVAREFKPYGYDMVCTDGFIPMLANDETGYMTHYGSMSLKDLVAKCKAKGLKVGVYDNPLWIHGPGDTKVPGTEQTFQNLYYNGVSEIMNPGAAGGWFNWTVAEYPGTREYIDGFFKHYHDLGIDYIRMDFLSWYEDGKDRNIGVVGHGYGHASYARALSYIAESANKYGIFTSLVMPHLYNDAELEKKYGHMIRIVSDTAGGGWWHCSEYDRGVAYSNWPNCMNMFDGFTYWSHVAGRGNVIMDGDFIRLNTFSTDAEKQTVISLQLMAGGPVTIADQISTIGNDARFYQNAELLALNTDGFAGMPLSDSLLDEKNQIWYGQMSNGDYVIGLFNRSDATKTYDLPLSEFGIDGEWKMRDLWKHADEGAGSRITANIEPHGCKIIKLSR